MPPFQKEVVMKFFILTIVLCNIGILSIHSHSEDSPWGGRFKTFQELIETDPNSARVELQTIAKELYKDHPLAEEWISLYFRINSSEEHSVSDFVRVHELEIRMLIDIDSEKYTKQIQTHQKALKNLEGLVQREYDELLEKTSSTKQKHISAAEMESAEEKRNAEMAYEHYEAFHELLPTNLEAARAELDAFASLAFHGHPLTEEWRELFFRLTQKQKGTIPEHIRFFELQKQIFIDNDAEKYAKQIKQFENALKQLEAVRKLYEKQGILGTQMAPFRRKTDK